ncbi:MAG TPA: hypothetical protein VGM87_06390, partial [Roseomonas sp.]
MKNSLQIGASRPRPVPGFRNTSRSSTVLAGLALALVGLPPASAWAQTIIVGGTTAIVGPTGYGGSTYVSPFTGMVADVLVTGPTAFLEIEDSLYLAGGLDTPQDPGGTAILVIDAGAQLQIDNPAGASFVGQGPGGTGTVTVTGPGSTWTNLGGLQIGVYGTGTLTITDSGQVTAVQGIGIGVETGGNGTITVTGAGAALASSAQIQVGIAGTGTLTIAQGGKASSAGPLDAIGAGAGGTGTVT